MSDLCTSDRDTCAAMETHVQLHITIGQDMAREEKTKLELIFIQNNSMCVVWIVLFKMLIAWNPCTSIYSVYSIFKQIPRK